ncbi:restriction endonuclease subunit S [Actinomadura harenae]|uniref:Restriction endonuclease subunit S n=1 Tax=Actinomadura harenae TaxID=2483351 RepID=A0A3M2LRC6_9ACTN|nr:restriction endonuclease subunit S [Actinomadura harenae]RMI39440.1 restriction endonuclease subunit S [Actinomadura harenae]
MNKLPDNWTWAELGELGTWYGGSTPSKKRPDFWENGTIPWLSPKDMGADRLTATQDLITESALRESSVRLIPANSVAIVIRSGILERKVPVAYVPFATTLNQDMKAVRPRDDVDPRWITWGLKAFERQILDTCRKTGTTVASLEVPWLMKFKLPIPHLSEQQRILADLEEHLSRLQVTMRALKDIESKGKQMRSQILGSAFSGQF